MFNRIPYEKENHSNAQHNTTIMWCTTKNRKTVSFSVVRMRNNKNFRSVKICMLHARFHFFSRIFSVEKKYDFENGPIWKRSNTFRNILFINAITPNPIQSTKLRTSINFHSLQWWKREIFCFVSGRYGIYIFDFVRIMINFQFWIISIFAHKSIQIALNC